eukprot:CAMPEP_0196749814 /NCGR_PEP_ID=MMETSP1091-20130531/78371_1 /TAXON_ID=302021 /ORGANISM="Rhodomonas sp., Strain CCMP768" /LENGTH=147 /DNA_ID=CAMNT_0042097351 /DNA_START=17 /DNA_END=456 /DNA_ORIENTATION=+
MPRAMGSDVNRQFALCFATSLTCSTQKSTVGCVAKHSLFDLMGRSFPVAVRSASNRTGLTPCEFKKVLGQNAAFVQIRSRKVPEELTRYIHRRLFDPDNEEELKTLRNAWLVLSQIRTPGMPFTDFVEIIRDAVRHNASLDARTRPP